MRILLVHNFYQQSGGEDTVFAAEGALLENQGHEVLRYVRHNDELQGRSKIAAAASAVWNRSARHDLGQELARFRPEVVHFHNIFPLISPAAYYAAAARRVAIVQTLHNYRLVCVNGYLFRNGRACTDCLGRRFAGPGVRHGCYRDSRAASFAVAASTGLHRLFGTWSKLPDRYIALTPFAQQIFVDAGLPPDKVVIKPNFIDPDPGMATRRGDYAVFVGRLSPEKGIATMLSAWRDHDPGLPLRVLGTGPMQQDVAMAADANLACLGQQPRERVLEMIGAARCVVFPSQWYEGFPMTIVEALAKGTPVVASRIGGLPGLIEPGVNGELFTPGDARDLSRAVRRAVADPVRLATLQTNARRTYEDNYTAAANYRQLMEVYAAALESAHGRPISPTAA